MTPPPPGLPRPAIAGPATAWPKLAAVAALVALVALGGIGVLLSACHAPPAERDPSAWRCELRWSTDQRRLDGVLHLPSGAALTLRSPAAAAAFFRFDGDAAAEPAAERLVPAAAGPRRVAFHLALADAAEAIDDDRLLARSGRSFVGAVSLLLPEPVDASEAPLHLEVEPPPSERFACVFPRRGAGWSARVADLARTPSCCFGGISPHTLSVPDLPVAIEVAHLAPPDATNAAALDDHLAAAVRATAAWFRHFPVDRLLVVVIPVAGRTIASGNVRGDGGACVRLYVGRRLDPAALADDWVVFHEFVHLALPTLPTPHRWFDEGVATYVEPLLQASLGRLTPAAIWRARLDEYAQGVPSPGSGGLDDDASWGRTYYGGAAFCLLADLRIRAATGGTHSLQHALMAVVDAGGSVTEPWSLAQLFAVAGRATGSTVLQELYAQFAHQERAIDLDGIWRELGLGLAGERLVVDDAAPSAHLRAALVPPASLGAEAQSPR